MNNFFKVILFNTFMNLFITESIIAQNDYWTEKSALGNKGPLPGEKGKGFSIDGKAYVMSFPTADFSGQFWEYDPATNLWTRKADFPGSPKWGGVAFSIGNKGYVGGGAYVSLQNSLADDFWEYDPVTNVWTKKADLPAGGRFEAVGFSIGNLGYVGTGYGNAGPTKDFWEYNPVSNSWTRRADFGGNARSKAFGFSIGDKGYVGTGTAIDQSVYTDDFWEYDPATDSWIQKAGFGGGVTAGGIAFSIGNTGYAGGGNNYSYGTKKDFWSYDPVANVWSRRADLTEPVSYAVAFSIGNYGYVGSGMTNAAVGLKSTHFEQYDPMNDRWMEKAGFAETGRERAVAFTIGDKAYVGTGLHKSIFAKNDFWEYDFATDSWTQKADVPPAERGGAMGFAVNGKGYISMGTFRTHMPAPVPSITAKTVWEFDPLQNTWTQKKDFPGVGSNTPLTFTIGNKAYFAATDVDAKELWQYDSYTDSWTQKNPFPGETRSGAIAVAISDKGYIGLGGTGFPGIGIEKNDFWQYDPLTDSWTRKADFIGTARREAVAFNLGNRAYVATGYNSNTGLLTDVWEYNATLDKWTERKSFPGPARVQAVAFNIGEKGFISSGYGLEYSDLWQYSIENAAPVANGWLMKYYSPDSVLLNAWGSYDPDGGPITVSWTKIAGPDTYTMYYGNASTPLIFNMISGRYTFRLTVTDINGASAISDVSFDVKKNLPPIANGWVMKYYSSSSVLMNAWGSYDPEGGPVSFLWRKIAGPPSFSILYSNSSTPVLSDLVTGVYTMELTVIDQEGAEAKDTVDVPVNSLSAVSSGRYNPQELQAITSLTSSLKLFPNPVTSRLQFQWINNYSGGAIVSVMDMSGRTVKTLTIKKEGEIYSGSLDLSELKTGVFQFIIKGKNKKGITSIFLKK